MAAHHELPLYSRCFSSYRRFSQKTRTISNIGSIKLEFLALVPSKERQQQLLRSFVPAQHLAPQHPLSVFRSLRIHSIDLSVAFPLVEQSRVRNKKSHLRIKYQESKRITSRHAENGGGHIRTTKIIANKKKERKGKEKKK